MDLRCLESDAEIKILRRWSAMEGQVVYMIFERQGRFFYATSWETDESPHEIYFDPGSGDFVFRNGFKWNSKARRYEYYELSENPFCGAKKRG